MKRNLREYKKKYFICKDDNGETIYMGDIVEVHDPMETKTPYQSKVYWNRVDGAFIDPHPAHKSMGHNSHRFLRGFIGKQDRSCWVYHGPNDEDSVWKVRTTKCVKVKSFKNV
jgi:hypothetical protein